MEALKKIVERLNGSGAKTPADLARIKRETAKRYGIPCPSNRELLKAYHETTRVKRSLRIERLLRVRPIRSLSGIVNVSVLTKPYPCPGKCVYCPSEKGAPKSYLKNEPAVMRAVSNKYDPFKQTEMRLKALKEGGHPIDKIDLRIIGGTWSFYPKNYQSWFVKRCFDACNKSFSKNLFIAQKKNEKSCSRIIGISVETRPDFVTKEEITRLRRLGITGVELGVQSLFDDVLKINKRGHKVEETILATELLKNTGFKVCYQMMPNLPGSDLKKDVKMFKVLFLDQRFRPDWLKIYPTAILKNSLLHKWWKKGKYEVYTDRQAIDLIKSIKKIVPYYVRIQRIIRDIPSRSITTGPARISNLRQVVGREIKNEKWSCKCIRCREVRSAYESDEKVFLFRKDFTASNGKEVFLTMEDRKRKRLYSLLRLRKQSKYPVSKILDGAALIRELHTYGQLQEIKKERNKNSPQHTGLGKRLMEEAEKIVEKEFKAKKIAVISGIGVRGYYRKLGYDLRDTYMVKNLDN